MLARTPNPVACWLLPRAAEGVRGLCLSQKARPWGLRSLPFLLLSLLIDEAFRVASERAPGRQGQGGLPFHFASRCV